LYQHFYPLDNRKASHILWLSHIGSPTYPVDKYVWINLIMIQGKKASGIYFCLYFHELTEAYVHEPFSTPFSDEILEKVAGNS